MIQHIIQRGANKYLLEDDGYRFYVTVLETPAINVVKNERMFLMEYKQFDYPGISNAIVEAIHDALRKQEPEQGLEYLICDERELKGPCRIYAAACMDLAHRAALIRDNDPLNPPIFMFAPNWKADPVYGPIIVLEGHTVNVIADDGVLTRLFYIKGVR